MRALTTPRLGGPAQDCLEPVAVEQRAAQDAFVGRLASFAKALKRVGLAVI
jgi:hypothetical protein